MLLPLAYCLFFLLAIATWITKELRAFEVNHRSTCRTKAALATVLSRNEVFADALLNNHKGGSSPQRHTKN